MGYTIKFSKKADKQFSKLDKYTAQNIVDGLKGISRLHNPRSKGKALTGNLRSFWRYRVGDYRIICDIQDNEITILVIAIGHRRDIYRQD